MDITNQFSTSNSRDTVSIQNSYKLYVTPGGVLTCDDVIKIPLAYKTGMISRADGVAYKCIPGVEIITPNSEFNIKIITNEGITVEPLSTSSLPSVANPYLKPRFFFSLPSNATGIKGVVFKSENKSLRTNLQFGIMPPPYNYDIAMIGVITNLSQYTLTLEHELERNVSKIEDRVDDLKNKTDNLKLTTKSTYFESIDFPKGEAEILPLFNCINNLFFETEFSYPSSTETTIHKPKIILRYDDSEFVYTLSLDRTVNTVSIDLFTGMITVYDRLTGEIMQQLKLAVPYLGYDSLSFADFDDIVDSVLRVDARGANVYE